MAELKEQLESVRTELTNSKSLSDSLKQELEQVREKKGDQSWRGCSKEREKERRGGRERERSSSCVEHT